MEGRHKGTEDKNGCGCWETGWVQGPGSPRKGGWESGCVMNETGLGDLASDALHPFWGGGGSRVNLEHAWECGRFVVSTASQQPGCQLSGLICRWTSCLDRYMWQNRNPTSYSVFQISNDPSLCPQITHPKLSISSGSSERLLLTDETPRIFTEKGVWMWQVEFYN